MLSQIIFITLFVCGEAVLFNGDRIAEMFTRKNSRAMKRCFN